MINNDWQALVIGHTRNHENRRQQHGENRSAHVAMIGALIVDLKRRNCLKVGTEKPRLKVKMQSVSDDDVWKSLLEKPRFELALKGVFRLGRCYILWQGIPGLWASNQECTTDGCDRLTSGARRRLVLIERSDHLPVECVVHNCTGTSGQVWRWRCTSVKNSESQQDDLIFNPLWRLESGQCVSDVIDRR